MEQEWANGFKDDAELNIFYFLVRNFCLNLFLQRNEHLFEEEYYYYVDLELNAWSRSLNSG